MFVGAIVRCCIHIGLAPATVHRLLDTEYDCNMSSRYDAKDAHVRTSVQRHDAKDALVRTSVHRHTAL